MNLYIHAHALLHPSFHFHLTVPRVRFYLPPAVTAAAKPQGKNGEIQGEGDGGEGGILLTKGGFLFYNLALLTQQE